MEVEGSDDDAAEGGKDDAWLRKAWRHVRREVTEFLAQEAAAKDAEVADEEEKQEPEEAATAGGDVSCAARPSRHIKDEVLAKWMRTVVDWQGEDDLLQVLRDEVTAAGEMEAFAQPMESSGTWDPDNLTHAKTDEELAGDLRDDLEEYAAPRGSTTTRAAQHETESPIGGSGSAGGGAEQPEAFDTTNMTRAERASLDKLAAARLAGAPIVDPPQASDVRQVVREDTPFYIALAFLKIFQTGAGDYWAFEQKRRERGMSISLWEWFQHVLRHRSG